MNKIIRYIFLFLLIFSPLAFGTVEQWSLTIMETLSCLALLLYFLYLYKQKKPFYEVPALLPLLLFLGYMLVQLVPLPPPLIRFISPSTYELYASTIGVLEPLGWLSLSINKKATLAEFFRYFSYAAFYILAIQLLSNREFLKKTVTVVIVFASLLAIFAMLQLFTSVDRIYWLRHVPINSMIVGPYVNHNHYAGLMEMIVPLVIALFLHYRPRMRYKESIRQRIVDLFSYPRSSLHILLGFAAILIVTSIFVSLSRGGMISASFSLVFLLFMLLRQERYKGKGGRVGFFIAITLVVLSISWFGWENIFTRFEKPQTNGAAIYEDRLNFWRDSVNIIKDYPLTGSGFGTFIDSFKGYRTFPGHRHTSILKHAHNDYIELLTDGGIIACLLVLWFLWELFSRTYKAISKRKEKYSIYLYWASVTGLLAIFIHSVTDFNLHIGANGLYFFFIAGLAVSAANTRMREKLDQTNLQEIRLAENTTLFAGGIVGLLLITGLVFNSGVMIGKKHFNSIKDVYLNVNIPIETIKKIQGIAQKAIMYDPFEARYYFAAANVAAFLPDITDAVGLYEKAIKINPTTGEYLQRLAYIKGVFREDDVADQLYSAGIRFDQNNPESYKQYAQWLFSIDEKEKGIENVKIALALAPLDTNQYITMMLVSKLTDEEMRRAMPERVRSNFLFADYLVSVGKEEMAEEVLLDALQYVEKERYVGSWYFGKVYWFYMKKKRYDEALNVVQEGLKYLPDNVNLILHSGQAYERLGITYRAKEEYEKALTIDPGNERVKKHLDRVLSRLQ